CCACPACSSRQIVQAASCGPTIHSRPGPSDRHDSTCGCERRHAARAYRRRDEERIMNARSAAGQGASPTVAAEPGLPPRPNWWIRAASSGWNAPLRSPEDRERVRRSRLTAWIILGLLLATLVLLPGGLAAPMTLVAIATVDVGLIIAVVLNR